MTLTAYMDDSGSDKTSPVYVLGGVVLPTEWWVSLSEEWSGVLGAPPRIDYFKGSEVGDRDKGPFKDFTGEQRQHKVESLIDVLCERHPLAFSASVKWSVFEKFQQKYNPLPGCNDPYFFLYYNIIALAAQYGQRESNPTPVDFVFDEHGKIGQAVHNWYSFFDRHIPPELHTFLGKDPVFRDEKKCLPLQAADLFAWYGRRSTLDSFNNAWEWQKIAWQVLSRYHTSAEVNMEALVAMASDFGIIVP
jgi:Protein of unknown function (DUF3800)